jgi:hypothetical protein
VGSICISGDDAGAGGVPEVGHAAGKSSWFLSYLVWERRLVELEMNNKNLSTYIWWSIAFAFVIGYAISLTKGLSGFVMGLAILLLLVKPHIGGPLAVLYLLWSRKRETILVIIGIVLLSMAVWGWDWLALWGNLEDFRWIRMVSYHLPLDHGEFDVVSFLEIGAS